MIPCPDGNISLAPEAVWVMREESIPSFKPKLLRSGNGVAEKACHAVACATQFGLTQVLAPMSKKIAALGLLLVGIGFSALAWQINKPRPDPEDPYGMAFEFLGCPGDWPADLPIAAIVKREPGTNPSFFVRDPAACGLAVKKPRYKLDGSHLTLSYTLYAPDAVAACYCEFNSRFTFKHLPPTVKSVSFIHRSE